MSLLTWWWQDASSCLDKSTSLTVLRQKNRLCCLCFFFFLTDESYVDQRSRETFSPICHFVVVISMYITTNLLDKQLIVYLFIYDDVLPKSSSFGTL